MKKAAQGGFFRNHKRAVMARSVIVGRVRDSDANAVFSPNFYTCAPASSMPVLIPTSGSAGTGGSMGLVFCGALMAS